MIASLLSSTSSSAVSQPAGRSSQSLPTVKCSTCSQPVPMDELGDHTCTAPPPLPTGPIPPKPTNTTLLPARLQGRVASPGSGSSTLGSGRAQEPQQQGPSSSSTSNRLRVNTRGGNGGSSPTQSTFQPRSSPLARRDPETASTEVTEIPFPSRMRTPSNASEPRGSPFPPSSMPRMRTPSNASSNPAPRIRTPSNASSGTIPPPRMRTPSNASSAMSVPMSRTRTPSNAGQMPTFPPPPIPNGNPPRPHVQFSNDNMPPLRNNPGLPGGPGRPLPGQQQRSPSINSMHSVNLPPPGNRPMGGGMPPPGAGPPGPYYNMNPGNGGPRPMGGPPPPQIPIVRPPPGPQEFIPPPERGIDTKSGGAAGMAGVGRRGFAAAARAAMFAGPGPNGRPPGPPYMGGQQMPPPPGQYGMRRQNAPQYLDINSNSDSRSSSTPPLSPSGYSSHSPGPASPLSQMDFNSNYPMQSKTILPITQPETRTPSPSMHPASTSTANATVKPPTPPDAGAPPNLPFFEKIKGILPSLSSPTTPRFDASLNSPSTARPNYDTKTPTSDTFARKDSAASSTRSGSRPRGGIREADPRPTSTAESESEYGGLAYADSTDYEDDDAEDDFNSRQGRRRSRSPPPAPPSTATPASAAQALLERAASKTSLSSSSSRIQFGSVQSRSRSRSNDRGDIRIGMAGSIRSGSSLSRESSVSSSYSNDNDRLDDLAARLERSGSSASKMSAVSNSSSRHLRARGVGLPESPAKPSPSISRMPSATSSSSQKPPVGSSVSGSIRSRLGSDVAVDNIKDSAARGSDDAVEDDNSVLGAVTGSKAHRSNTVQGLQSPEAAKRSVKLPTRSLTSPKVEGFKPLISDATIAAGGAVKQARKPRTCMKCQKAIEGGRWVSVDNGGVLCEKCWKNMYLPKCRRCDLTIEKAAVSSSDGQLKGKYHKECFNCHTCHKPFPDKTFYVYDGKPFCDYHYHEANDSLCAAARCGQPIEGPCAVSHNGDRYHPEHMTCEYPEYPCRERLNEYWEVDGRMLCERHAHNASGDYSDGEDEDRWVQSSKAMKRVTRFIDLTGAGGTGPAPAPVVGNRL